MPIVVVGNEKNFAALRPRLFGGARVSTKTAGSVADAVRKANPHVDLDKLTPGTVLTIPDTADVSLRREIDFDAATGDALAGLAEHGKTVLGELAGAAERRSGELRDDRARALEAFDKVGDISRSRERGLAKSL